MNLQALSSLNSTWTFFAYLEDAMQFSPDEESVVDDFAVFLLKMLEYDVGRRVIHTRKDMPFYMCGMKVDAKADVTILKRTGPLVQYVLLVEEDKSYQSGDDPEPQLIAKAIAAFYQNNFIRKQASRQRLESQTFPCITMAGTAPQFYKITITQDLLLAVEGGEYPSQPTVVEKLELPVADLANYDSQGMMPLENRRVLLKCFESFKTFLNDDAW